MIREMDVPTQAPPCPCKREKCPRHGNCKACREHHAGKATKTACQRQDERAAKRGASEK